MKILDLKNIPKIRYFCMFNYTLKDETINIDSYLKNNSFRNYDYGILEKKDYIIDNYDNLLLFLNEIFDKIILSNKKNDEIYDILNQLDVKNFCMNSKFYSNLNEENSHDILKNYFLMIVDIQNTNKDGIIDLSTYFDFDRKNLNNYYINSNCIMNYSIYETIKGIFVLQYIYFVSFKNIEEDDFFIKKLENICNSNLINKDYYIYWLKRNRSYCFDIYDFENVPTNFIYIKSYLLNIGRCNLHDYKLIPHIVNASKNRKFKIMMQNSLIGIHQSIKDEILEYVNYIAKERLTYKDFRPEYYVEDNND